MRDPSVSVSTVAYDGRPLDLALAQIAALGVGVVEPAFIKGYMDFDEDDLSEAAGTAMRRRIAAHGLDCIALSLHMDQGSPEAREMLARRLRFAAAAGARIAITNATSIARRDAFSRVIEHVLPIAEELGVTIALENPGHGDDDLMPDGARGGALVASFDTPWLRLNYDTGNVLTHSEGAIRPDRDIGSALPVLAHVHLKDVVRRPDGWRYVAIGEGEIDPGPIVAALAERPDVPLGIELPLRLLRPFRSAPRRDLDPPDEAAVAAAVRASLVAVERHLAGRRPDKP